METAPLLTILGVVPLIGGLIALLVKGRAGKLTGFVFSLITLAIGLVVFFSGSNLAEQVAWIPSIGAFYALGLDGMGKAMVLLTVILVPIVLLAEWNLPDEVTIAEADEQTDGSTPARIVSGARWGAHVFSGLVLLLQGLALFVFLSTDVLLFYIFFEATLIPMYFLIIGWGGERRSRAALKFLLFSLAGGLIMLAGVIGVYVTTAGAGKPSFLISDFAGLEPGGLTGKLLFLAFFFAFMVKAPMVPVHTWLPDTAEEANPGATTLLVGILDKIGTFGMIRLCLGLFPEAAKWAAPLILVLAVISIIYGAFMAIASTNLLRLVAYTSVSHFGFMVLGIFAFTTVSLSGTMFYMLAHGFSSAAMFLVVEMLVNRRGTADISGFGGWQKMAPLLAGVFLVSGLATLGLPGTMNFAGEFSIMVGAFGREPIFTVIAVLGTVLAAVYVLWAYQRVFTGEPTAEAEARGVEDLTGHEKLVVAPLIALLLAFGFVSGPLMSVVESTATATMTAVGLSDPETGSQGGK